MALIQIDTVFRILDSLATYTLAVVAVIAHLLRQNGRKTV